MIPPVKNLTGLASSIVFYCKDCHKVAEVKRIGKRYAYTCSACGTKNVAFGTVRSISQYFGVEEPVVAGTPVAPAETSNVAPAVAAQPTPEIVKS
ncbi:MAG: hypothetical protein WC882_03160 [Candidatus Gracilibacteria bacterium]